ncbi:MAG: hypothetical protein QG597_2907 [Actinomycetota bacterium]|nr:hypothetical protein [Actinomycetota bacterium]
MRQPGGVSGEESAVARALGAPETAEPSVADVASIVETASAVVPEDAGSGRSGAARRRRRVPGGRRQMLNVRYTQEELEQVTARAAAAGWEVTSYVAEAALWGPTRTEDAPGRGVWAFRMGAPERRAWAEELMAVRRIVGATANNVNQLARAANATGEVPVQAAVSLAACERAMNRLSALLEALEDAR